MRIVLLLLYLSGLYAANSQAESSLSVTYFYSQMPPFEYVDERGEAAGTGIARVKDVLDKAGFASRFVFFSVPRGENELQVSADITSVVAPTSTQRQQWRVSQYPLYEVSLGVVRRDDVLPLQRVETLLSTPYLAMQEMQFSFLRERNGLSALTRLRSDVTDNTAGIRLIKNRKADYFLTYFPLKSESWRDEELLFEEIEILPVYLVVFNAHPDVDMIMQKIDRYLATEQKVNR